MKRLARFFVNVKQEMKKVKWPTKKELFSNTATTLVFMVIFAFFFSMTDTILAYLKTVIN